MDLAGPPYYASPLMVVEWTLPQAIFAWLRRQEDLADQGRQEFLLRVAAIGAAISGKEGKGIVNTVLKSFDGIPLSPNEMMESLDETQKLVLYGKSRMERDKKN